MNSHASMIRRCLTLVALIMVVAGLVFLLMVPFSFLSYTSFGFDLEYEKEQQIVEDFYRIRWPGDGSFRMGCGAIHYTLDEEDVDPIDLAARFLQPPQSKLSGISWNRFAVAKDLPGHDNGRLASTTWLIIPSWIPGILLMIFPVLWYRQCRKQTVESVNKNSELETHQKR